MPFMENLSEKFEEFENYGNTYPVGGKMLRNEFCGLSNGYPRNVDARVRRIEPRDPQKQWLCM